ncbi:retinal G protein coupled receptor a isoform X2 [Brachyhypopomus gauderio]|uniref:retinal G protein coupled receptor a isoform X2 n=1 Tax=Brachyhypopomus gauderio TaxID=698409 RepID=UPI0040414065
MSSYPLPEGFSEFEVFALGSCLLVEGLLGFLLNAVTAVAFLKIRESRTPSNFLVFCLALADMGISTNSTVAAFSSFLSIHFIAAIAWDRYHQYCTRTKLQWTRVITLAVFIWFFAAFWAAMPLIGWGEYDYEPLRTCCTLDISKGDRNYVSYVIPMAICNMGIQVLVVFSSYQSIGKKFKKTGQERFNCTTPLKTLLLCWGPYGILALYATVKNASLLSPKLRMIAPIMAKTSPIFNVFVYALGNENYRGGIWQLLTGQKTDAQAIEDKSK